MLDWPALALALAILFGSFGFARHRAGDPAARLATRTDRVWHGACLFGAAAILTDTIPDIGRVGFGWLAVFAVAGFFLVAGASLIWMLAADLAMSRLGAVRNRRWMIAAPLACILVSFLLLVVPFAWWQGGMRPLQAVSLAADAAAAGLLWWSYLAADEHEVARLFD